MSDAAKDLMTDAVEHAIYYWAEVRKVKRDPDLTVNSFEVRDDEHEFGWSVITPEAVHTAVKRIRDGEIKISPDIQKQFDDDEWNYDADGADCVIQVVYFGEIVFS